jgi:hypothetical protein
MLNKLPKLLYVVPLTVIGEAALQNVYVAVAVVNFTNSPYLIDGLVRAAMYVLIR